MTAKSFSSIGTLIKILAIHSTPSHRSTPYLKKLIHLPGEPCLASMVITIRHDQKKYLKRMATYSCSISLLEKLPLSPIRWNENQVPSFLPMTKESSSLPLKIFFRGNWLPERSPSLPTLKEALRRLIPS